MLNDVEIFEALLSAGSLNLKSWVTSPKIFWDWFQHIQSGSHCIVFCFL